jgi:hypothetical protein
MTTVCRQLQHWCGSLGLSLMILVVWPTVASAQSCNDNCNPTCLCQGYCSTVFEVHTDWNLACYHCGCTNGTCTKRGNGVGPDECYVCCSDGVAWCDEANWLC